MQQQISLKRSLCRYYLRGLCNLQKEICHFAHGIKDLDYRPMEAGQEVEYDYLKQTEFTQRSTLKGPRVYVNLYEFQSQKKYTLQELNDQKQLRVEVRNQMHHQLFHDFIDLLEATYPGANFTEDFLLQEYTRVGFNKLMTRIKFSHLIEALCQGQNPRYFLKAIKMPPLLNQTQNFLFKRPPTKEIIDCYRKECEQIIKKNQYKIDQAELKKKLFNRSYFDRHLPTLSQILKERKVGFSEFLKSMNSFQESKLIESISLEATLEEIVAVACKYLDSASELISWSCLFSYLSKELKINNGNVLNQVKAQLILKGYYLLFFPMTQLIITQDHPYPFRTEADLVCNCSFKQPFVLTELPLNGQSQDFILKEGDTVDINDWDSLINCTRAILGSKVLGVDLEGRLKKGGFIETVQLSNGRNTFLVDLYQLIAKKDTKTLEFLKRMLRNVFVDRNILKVFHDCRHDSLALHECLETCILNIFDTSAVQTLKTQIEIYINAKAWKGKPQPAKNAVAQCSNIRAVGLNQILKKYQASHGINRSKEKFHKMWKEGEVDFFLQRPMDPDYRDYCIRDVLDLPEIHAKMTEAIPRWSIELGKWVSAWYVSYGYEKSGAMQTVAKQNEK